MVVSDLGTSDLGNSAEENLLHLVESDEMKGVTTPLNSAAIMPSPILLWRLEVLLFFIWGFSCCKIGWDSVMRMSADLRNLFLYEAFLYYNPLLLVTMMVWFWGINLWVFVQANCATWMTIIVPTSMTAYLYLYSHGEVSLAAFQLVKVYYFSILMSVPEAMFLMKLLSSSQVLGNYVPKRFILHNICIATFSFTLVLLYAAVAMVLIFPFDIFYLSSRYFLLSTLWQMVFPLQVFSDLERSVCRMTHRQVATIAWLEADSVCGSHAVAIPSALYFSSLSMSSAIQGYWGKNYFTELDWDMRFVGMSVSSISGFHMYAKCHGFNRYLIIYALTYASGFTRILKFSKMHFLLSRVIWKEMGLFLGIREQSDSAVHMDVLAICPSPP